MNRIFKTIWSKVNHQTVVVSEAQGTQSSRKADKRVRNPRSGGMALTAAAAAVMAATMGSAQAAIDTSTWTVTGSDAVLSQDLDYTGATYGRIQGFSGWAGTDTNKLTIAAGSTITGGVFGYENDPFWGDESNTGAEGSSGLLRYHTFVVNGALKDADTYHDVATNADKPQVGTVNWFNRLALGTTGVVNVKEVRLAEAFKNEGSFTVNDFYVKEGAELENSGTMTVKGNAVLGTANATIFDKNLYDISGEELTAGSSGTFTNSGTMTVNGTLTNFSNITDTESAGNWTVNKFLNGQVATTTGNEIKPSMRIAKDMHIKDTLWNNGTVEIGGNLTVDVYGTGTEDSADKVEKDSSDTSDSSKSLAYTSTAYTKNLGTLKAGSMNLTGIKNYITSSYLETTDSTTTSSLGIVTNGGTIKLAGNANLTALNQIAAYSKDSEGTTSTVVMPTFTAQKDVTIEGLLKNVARDYTYDAAEKGGVIDVKGNLSAQDIVSTGTITANNLTSGKDILNYGTIKTVGNITNTTTITNYGILTAGGKLSTDELLNDETVTITSANIAKVNNEKNFTVTGDANTQVISNVGETHLNNVLLTDMGAVDKSSSPIAPALFNRWDNRKQKIGKMFVTGKVTFDSSLAGKETWITNSGHMELGEVDGNDSKLTISSGSLVGEMVLNGNVKAYLLENSSGSTGYIKANNIDIEVSAVSNGNVMEVCGAGSKLTGVKKLTATRFVNNAGILEAKEIIAGTLYQGDPNHFEDVNFDDPEALEYYGFDGNVTTTAEKITVGNYKIYGPTQRIKLELTGTEDSQITGSYKTYLSGAETNEHSKLSKLISNSSLIIGGEFDNASQVQIAQNLTLGKTLANHVYSNVADSGNINVQGTLRWDAYKQTYNDDDGTKEVTSFNDGKIVAGILQGAGIDNHVGATLEATNAAASSSLGIVSNLGTITLAGKSTFAAVTNAGTINLAADTSMASLTQTAGTTTAGAALTLSADSATAGTVSVTGLLTTAGLTNTGSVTAAQLSGKTYTGSGTSELSVTDSATLGSLALSDSGKADVTKSLTLGTSASDTGSVAAGTTLTVGETLSVVKGAALTIASGAVVSADTLALGDASSAGSATVNSSSASFKHLTAANGGSVLTNGTDLTLDDVNVTDGFTYNQTAGSFKTADNSFFKNATLNIMGGTLDRTGGNTRAAGDNTLGTGNTVNISGVTPGSFTDKTQVGSDWKDGQTVVSVGILNSDSTVNLKSGGILETSDIALTSNTLHFDGGALTASLINFFDGVSEKVYKITDGSETTIDTNVLGAADVSDVKDSFKDNIDFTANGGTIVITDAAVSLKAIASASDKLKALAGEGADNVNVVFTGTAAGSSGTLTGFFHNTYQELAAEQGQGSSFKNPGVVFATMAYENRAEDGGATRDKLVVGTAAEAADTFVLGDSIGFARVEGTDNVTVNSGKTFALVGGAAGTNLLDSAAGTLTVTGADSKFVMGTKGVAGTEGVLGTLNVTESGAMNVAMGKYTVTNLALTKGTGSTDVGTTLTVAKLTDDAASTFDNKGTLSVTAVDTVNSAFTNSGTLNVASNTVLANTFTNNAGRAVFDGTVEMQKAVTNAKDAVIKTAGFTVSSALTGSAGNVINNAGRLESTGANTVAGSMVVAKDGALVATDVTNITTGRINVLGDSRFKEVNVGVNGSGALGAAADALIHADTITVGTMGQLRLRDGATVVAKNLKVDGMMSAGTVSWALGTAAVNSWNKKNADRYAALMGEYATTTAMLSALSSRAAFGIATYDADTVKSSVDHTVVASPAADTVILEAGNGEKYWIDTDRTSDFSMLATVGGTVGTSGNIFSADTSINYTYTFDTAVVKADADATFLDVSYILEGKTLTVNEGGTIFIEDTEDKDYQPGVMVVRGNLINNGDIMSTDGTGLVVAGSGVVTIGSTGTDVGKTLVVTGDGTYKVDGGEADYAGLELKSGTLNVAKGWFGYGLAKDDAGYTGDKSAVFATNLDTIETNDARLIVGTVAAGDTVTAGSVYFGEDSALVLDTSNLVDKTIFKGNNSGTFTVKVGSELAVSHTTWGKHYILGDGYDLSGFTDDAWNGDYIKNLTGDDMQLAVSKTEDGKLMLSAGAGEDPNPPTPDPDPDPDPTPDPAPDPDPTPDPDPDPNPNPQPDTSIRALSPDFAVPDVIDGLINDEANIGLRDPNSDKMDVAFIERVLDKNYVGTTADGKLDVKKATRLWNSVVEMSAASGSTAYSIGQVSDTMGMIEDRAAGLDLYAQKKDHLWVKPMGKYSKADKLKGEGSMTGGYEATTYGLMLGADASDESLTLGGALSYAKGDLKSRGDWTATDTDVELYGINAYGAVRQGKAAFIGHVGYAQSKGEAKQNFSDVQGNGYSVKSDIKNKMITAGLRGEIRFDVTDSVVVTPHLGIRYVKTKTDGYDITMNGKQAFKAGKADGDLWQLPLGVSVKADLWEGAWKLAPYADISVVRQFGDTDMTTSVSATSYAASDSYRFDVAGKTMGEVKLGISAERKNHTFGLSYTGAVGTQGTQTHALTAHYDYRF